MYSLFFCGLRQLYVAQVSVVTLLIARFATLKRHSVYLFNADLIIKDCLALAIFQIDIHVLSH